jgi:hypothetical protein
MPQEEFTGLSRRYEPEFSPGESCLIGLDMSPILAPGVGIASGNLAVFTNTAVPAPADSDFTIGPVAIEGRVLYATISGGKSGIDYQIRWTCTDSDGNVFPRTVLMLCAPTS